MTKLSLIPLSNPVMQPCYATLLCNRARQGKHVHQREDEFPSTYKYKKTYL
ncbi:MAG: hypothetical protein ABII90_04870 [Bacteroidota bacterium]